MKGTRFDGRRHKEAIGVAKS